LLFGSLSLFDDNSCNHTIRGKRHIKPKALFISYFFDNNGWKELMKMNWVYIVILMLAIFGLLIIFSKVKIHIQFAREADTNHFVINIKALYGLLRIEKKSELKSKMDKLAIGIKSEDTDDSDSKKEKKSNKFNITLKEFYYKIKDFIQFLERTDNLSGVILGFTRKVKIKKLFLKMEFGYADAAKTAQKYGVHWAIVGSELAFIQTVFDLVVYPEIVILPIFHQKTYSMEFLCITEFRVGQLMWAGLKFIFRWKGKKKYLIIPTIKEEAVN
jgi:hypothetical protein